MQTMTLTVEARVYHGLRKYLPSENEEGFSRMLSLKPGTKVADVFSALNIPSDIGAITFLNGERCKLNQKLKSGDVLSIMQPAGGG